MKEQALDVDVTAPLTLWEQIVRFCKAVWEELPEPTPDDFQPTDWNAVDNAPEGQESCWDKVVREMRGQGLQLKE